MVAWCCWCWWCWWCWWWSEWWNHPNISIFWLRFSSPEFTKSSNKFYPTSQPRESLSQHNPLNAFLSACFKTGQDPCKNKHGENCIVQVVCWYSVWLPGAAGVGGEVSEETIQTYLYSNCTFHHQNSQRVQTSFTLPTNLGKALANITHCTCFFQHVLKQDRIHARTNMGKIALCKLFAGILCGCVVLLVLVVKWVKKPSKHIYILTALFSTRLNKEFNQVLPYTVRVSVSLLENRTGSMQEQIWSKLHCASCLLVFCVVAWCCWCCSLVVKWMLERNHPIISNHILAALWNKQDSEKKNPVPYLLVSLSLSLSQPYFNRASSQPEFTKRQASSYRGNFGHYNLLYLLASSW